MVENIVAYIYSITGLIFFIAWQMNYSLTKYFLKEKNFTKTLYLELFFLIIIMKILNSNFKIIGQIVFVIIILSTSQAKSLDKFNKASSVSNYFSGILLLTIKKPM